MHQRQRDTRLRTATTRLLIGSVTALFLTAAIAVAWDPTEALCATLTSSDPLWHLLACWRFSNPGSPQG